MAVYGMNAGAIGPAAPGDRVSRSPAPAGAGVGDGKRVDLLARNSDRFAEYLLAVR